MRGIAISILQHQYLLAAMRRVAEITIFGAIVCCRKLPVIKSFDTDALALKRKIGPIWLLMNMLRLRGEASAAGRWLFA
jgi:hypothetical protein